MSQEESQAQNGSTFTGECSGAVEYPFTEPFRKFDSSVPFEDDKNIVFSVENDLVGHDMDVNSVIFFGSPHFKIVSCSDGDTSSIRIWCSGTGKCLKTIIKHKEGINDLVRLCGQNKHIFLSAGDDKTVRSFSILSPNYEQLKEFKMDSAVFRLLTLTEDLFLCRSGDGYMLSVLSHSSGQVHRRFFVGRLYHSRSHIFLSTNYSNCFYIPTNDEFETIKLVDYEAEHVVKEFKSHDQSRIIFSLCCFLNSKGEEILIVCDHSKSIYYYNTSSPKFNTNIKISGIGDSADKLYEGSENKIFSCFCLNDQYLVCGDRTGMIHLYQILGTQIRKVKDEKVFDDNYLYKMELLSASSDGFRMVGCSADHTAKICKFEGVNIVLKSDEEAKLDLEERIRFLLFDQELFYFEDLKMFVVQIRLKNDAEDGMKFSKLFFFF